MPSQQQQSVLREVCQYSLLSGRNLRWPRRMLPLVSFGVYTDETDRRTDGHQTVTLRFPLDTPSVKIQQYRSECTAPSVTYFK